LLPAIHAIVFRLYSYRQNRIITELYMVHLKYCLFDGTNKTEIKIFLGSMAAVGNIKGEGDECYLPVFHTTDWSFIKGLRYIRLKKNHYVIKIERTWAVVETLKEVIEERKKLKKDAVELEIRKRRNIDELLKKHHYLFDWNG